MKPIVDSLKVLGESTKMFESLRDNLFAPKGLKFNSQICTTKEQSERLLALGLKKETADMFWWDNGYGSCAVISRPAEKEDGEYGKVIPAWSLHRLIEMMPKCVMAHSSVDDSLRLHPYVPKFGHLGVTIENIDEILADFYQHTDLFDNLISCVEWLIKEGYFNKEYLQEQAGSSREE